MLYGSNGPFRLSLHEKGLPSGSKDVGRLSEVLRPNKNRKNRYDYHKRSLSETAMCQVKQLLGGKLSLRNDNAQIGET